MIDIITPDSSFRIDNSSKINIITGLNKSGKTKLLKKIYQTIKDPNNRKSEEIKYRRGNTSIIIEIEPIINQLYKQIFYFTYKEFLRHKIQNGCLYIIDGVGNGLDVNEQTKIILTLNTYNSNFLISTTSPFVLSDCDKDSILIVNNNQCYKPDFQTFGCSINIIIEKIFNREK